MNKISVFNYISLDGFFAGPDGEIDWFYSLPKDDEWERYTQSAACKNSIRTLIYGRTTYEMMKSFWPTDQAIEQYPEMADSINNSYKIVFSKTLKNVKEEGRWKNITLFNEINRERILKLKEKEDMLILGSGSIIRQFADLKLIDEYSLVVVPVVLGSGKSFFNDVNPFHLELVEARHFDNGIVMINYKVKN
jgi:dihydrofolate reductase